MRDKYKRKEHLKTFYYVLPVKQNGYPDLTAWTDNRFLAYLYAEQYRMLEPVILTCQGTSKTDPDVKKFEKEQLDMELGLDSEILVADVTAFDRPHTDDRKAYQHDKFLTTSDQEIAIGEQWSYTENQLYEVIGFAMIDLMMITRFLVDEDMKKVFEYVCFKYITRVLLEIVGDVNDLSDESREKLGLPLIKDTDCIDLCEIYNSDYLNMILLKNTTGLLWRYNK